MFVIKYNRNIGHSDYYLTELFSPSLLEMEFLFGGTLEVPKEQTHFFTLNTARRLIRAFKKIKTTNNSPDKISYKIEYHK